MRVEGNNNFFLHMQYHRLVCTSYWKKINYLISSRQCSLHGFDGVDTQAYVCTVNKVSYFPDEFQLLWVNKHLTEIMLSCPCIFHSLLANGNAIAFPSSYAAQIMVYREVYNFV